MSFLLLVFLGCLLADLIAKHLPDVAARNSTGPVPGAWGGEGYNESLAHKDSWLIQATMCWDAEGKPNPTQSPYTKQQLEQWQLGITSEMYGDIVGDAKVLYARGILVLREIDALAIVVQPSPAECVLTLRGSKSKVNWIEDANSKLKPLNSTCNDCDKCECVHTGVHTYWYGIREDVLENLGKCGTPELPLSIVAHSLGAAAASLAAYDLAKTGLTLKRVYLYAPYAVANHVLTANMEALLKEKLPNSYFRITYYKDLVPHAKDVFPNSGKYGALIGPEVFYYEVNEDHQYEICPKPEETKTCSAQYHFCLPGDTDESCLDPANVLVVEKNCYHCSYMHMDFCTCASVEVAGKKSRTVPRCVEQGIVPAKLI